MKIRLMIATALLALSMVACNGLSANVQIRQDENYNYLTVNMTEAEAQVLFAGIFENNNELPIINPTVDLLPGEISVSGEVPSDAGQTVPAELTAQFSVQRGVLNVNVTSASFAGWQGSAEQLAQFNTNIANGIAESMGNRTNDAELTEVTITDTDLSFTLRAPRDQ